MEVRGRVELYLANAVNLVCIGDDKTGKSSTINGKDGMLQQSFETIIAYINSEASGKNTMLLYSIIAIKDEVMYDLNNDLYNEVKLINCTSVSP